METEPKEKATFKTCYKLILIVLMWIGIWGVTDNLIDKFVGHDNYNLRILIFAMIFIVSFAIYYY